MVFIKKGPSFANLSETSVTFSVLNKLGLSISSEYKSTVCPKMNNRKLVCPCLSSIQLEKRMNLRTPKRRVKKFKEALDYSFSVQLDEFRVLLIKNR